MTFKLTGTGVDVSSGRGNARVTISVDFSKIEKWAKRMQIDTPKLMNRSFGRAAFALKGKFKYIMSNGGGAYGVPRFKSWEEFTVRLHGQSSNKIGGVLADPRRIVAFKRGGWQFIGWPDALSDWARKFQDAVGDQAQLNDPSWRAWAHRRAKTDYVPRTYVHTPRRVIPEPFGSYVEANLREWARGAYYTELARQMQKAGAL